MRIHLSLAAWGFRLRNLESHSWRDVELVEKGFKYQRDKYKARKSETSNFMDMSNIRKMHRFYISKVTKSCVPVRIPPSPKYVPHTERKDDNIRLPSGLAPTISLFPCGSCTVLPVLLGKGSSFRHLTHRGR